MFEAESSLFPSILLVSAEAPMSLARLTNFSAPSCEFFIREQKACGLFDLATALDSEVVDPRRLPNI